MLKKTITYLNIDGERITKDLYFNISSAELFEKEALSDQTYSQRLAVIADSKKLSDIYPTIIEFFEEGYGVRTQDGEFDKDPVHWKNFRKSLAFQALMEELLMDPSNNGTLLANFINGMLPADLLAKGREEMAQPGFRPGADTSRPTPPVAGQLPAQPIEVAPEQPVHVEQPIYTPPPAEAPPIQQSQEPRTPDLPGQPQPNLQDPQRYQQ